MMLSTLQSAILLYFVLMILIFYFQPSLVYCKKYKSFRQFGLGYSDKTILPIWLVSILLAIISYLGMLFLYENDNAFLFQGFNYLK
jgi:hypothetical protein